MAGLPVIVGFGGINPAGRSSAHHGYRRLVMSALDQKQQDRTWASLAALSGRLRRENGQWLDGDGQGIELSSYIRSIAPELEQASLIRRLENNLFEPDRIPFNRSASLAAAGSSPLQLTLSKRQLPTPLPPGWQISAEDAGSGQVTVTINGNLEVLLGCYRENTVNSAGQLPSGFDPGSQYQSRNHPRVLQMTVYAASDAINSIGLDWETIKQSVHPDQISVYAGSAQGQLDYNGFGGMLQARILGRKVTSKQMPLGYSEMPADFINAYLLGNVGTTGTVGGACSTFLYNLRLAMRDIQSGSHRVALVGTTEAPLFAESFDGFATMGALADDDSLRRLDGLGPDQEPDYRRACRPFGNNSGFTLAEAAQFVVLMDDALALELGASIYGAVNDIFVNADGHKKSITSPGLGNYITMAKAAAATRNIIGEQALRQRSYVQAHGTGTPQNRTTESHILSTIAGHFGIESWPVCAVKAYLGHTIASSAGDQLITSLGVWAEGIIPGILTIDGLADDVSRDGLQFLTSHLELEPDAMDAAVINSKGFGGNNASASVLAPHITERMLAKRHGRDQLSAYRRRNEAVRERAADYDQSAIEGVNSTIYKFDHGVMGSDALTLHRGRLDIEGFAHGIDLPAASRYPDMGEEDS